MYIPASTWTIWYVHENSQRVQRNILGLLFKFDLLLHLFSNHLHHKPINSNDCILVVSLLWGTFLLANVAILRRSTQSFSFCRFKLQKLCKENVLPQHDFAMVCISLLFTEHLSIWILTPSQQSHTIHFQISVIWLYHLKFCNHHVYKNFTSNSTWGWNPSGINCWCPFNLEYLLTRAQTFL